MMALLAACHAGLPDRPLDVTFDEAPTNTLILLLDDMGTDQVAAYREHPDPPATPTIDAGLFPSTGLGKYWSSTAGDGEPSTTASAIGFGGGTYNQDLKTNNARVRCIRDTVACTPACTDKACGDDGCGVGGRPRRRGGGGHGRRGGGDRGAARAMAAGPHTCTRDGGARDCAAGRRGARGVAGAA